MCKFILTVSRDSFRLMLKNEYCCDNKIEMLINELVDETIYYALSKKLNVLIDNTNLKQKYIDHFINKFKYHADIEYQIFDISLDKAIERDKLRQTTVGEAVIKRMYEDYKVLMDSFDFSFINKVNESHFKPIKYNGDLNDCVIFDLDGTLALMNGKRNAFDYKNVYKDDINIIVKEQIDFHQSKGRKIIILSGRDEVSMDLTKEWLELHEVYYDEIYMRKKDDYRKDNVVKKEIYENNIKDKYNVLAVYEDRHQVLKFWFEEGIFTYNVNQGNICY